MRQAHEVDRRRFLRDAALLAGSTILAACTSRTAASARHAPPETGGSPTPSPSPKGPHRGEVGSAPKPLPPPLSFQEAPALARLTAAGRLPAVADRLPERPYVVPHNWLRPGRYGGKLDLIVQATSGGDANSNREYMYGHSILRWLNDGLDVGPGLAERWTTNDDASEWTLHFRRGLTWSDGHPWTTADILFWWEDIVLDEETSQEPPDEARSGKGTLVKMSAPDDYTLVLTYDAPAPLTADRLAMWVNGGNGSNGPIWMLPKHYVKQFHPRYNPNAPKDWAASGGAMETKGDFARNPECPTMTGWRVKRYDEGRRIVWERNPYYWCVDRDGNQLPYIDTITMTVVQDVEVGKLRVRQGKVDYLHGPFFDTGLADISALSKASFAAKLDILFWDSGSGTGSMYFLNYDVRDEERRKVFRDPRFRQALSKGFDRSRVRREVYFESGFVTNGTLSPKATEYHVNDSGRQAFVDWRDSYVSYDPEAARKLLDDVGVVDKDGDGFRELPSGRPLVILLQHSSGTADEHLQKNNVLVDDWRRIGINAQDTPVPEVSFLDQWSAGELMTSSAWEVGDGPNHLVYPLWLVPIENTRWAPLEGELYALRGTKKEDTESDVDPFERHPPRMEPDDGGPVDQLWRTYDQAKLEPDPMRRNQLVWDMIKIHVEQGPFFSGTVANTPQLIVTKKDLKNVPLRENLAQHGFVNPWIHPTPAVYDPETYYWEGPGGRG